MSQEVSYLQLKPVCRSAWHLWTFSELSPRPSKSYSLLSLYGMAGVSVPTLYKTLGLTGIFEVSYSPPLYYKCETDPLANYVAFPRLYSDLVNICSFQNSLSLSSIFFSLFYLHWECSRVRSKTFMFILHLENFFQVDSQCGLQGPNHFLGKRNWGRFLSHPGGRVWSELWSLVWSG